MRRLLALALAAGVALQPLLPALAAEFPYFRYGMDTWRGGLARRLTLAYPQRPVTARANEPFSVGALPSGMDAGSAFSVVGQLPAGLSLGQDGTLYGISATPASFAPLTISLSDSTGAAVTAQTPPITVLPQLRFAYPSVLTGVAGAQFTAAPLVWDGVGGATRIELVSGSIPGNITFDPLTGVLAGIPPDAGETLATFALVDSSDGRRVSTGETRFVIAPAGPLAVAAASPVDGTLNQTYGGFAFAVTGGRAPMTFAITSGAMPAGIGLSKAGVASGTPTAEGSFPITVQVTDFDGRKVSGSATFKVNRDLVFAIPALARQTVGKAATPVAFGVANADGAVSWVASGLPDGMNLATDGTLSGTPTTAGTYSALRATVTDAGGHVKTTPDITLYVDAPLVAKGPASLPLGATGSTYATQTFTTTGGNGSITWTATGLPAGLSVTSAGKLQGKPTAAGSFSPVFTARDASARTDTVALGLEISAVFGASAPAIPPASVGVAYGPVRLSSAGGTGTVTWTVNSGTPPDGITLSAAGDIAGTPTTPGTGAFTARATDGDGKTADVPVSIPVSAPLVISTPGAFPRGTVGTAYAANAGNAYVASGGRAPISLSASGLFGGIGLSNGLLQGTPTAAGSGNVVITATDADGRTARSVARTLAVDARLAVTSAVLPADIAGTPMAPFGVQATGGRGAVTWTHDDAALHIGVTMDANGVIQGTPTSTGTRSYAVTATDADGRTASGTVSHTVDPSPTRPSISGAPPASIPASTALDVRPFTVTGGQGPYAFAVGSGYQPPGIAVGSDGRVSGTPTYAGTWSFTVRVTDSQGRTGEAGPYNMQVSSPYTITGSLPSSAKVGQPYTAQFYVSATPTSGKFFSYRRTGTSSWTSASQVVFPGVTIDMATGKVTGTPTTAGTYDGIEVWHDVGTWIGIGTFKVIVLP